jgi:hypothetical protein
MTIASAIHIKKIIFKMCIATDVEFPTKFLYAMEISIQCWLGECLKFDNRLMVNNCLTCFDEVFKKVLNSSLNVILPPNFIRPPPKNPTATPTVLPGEDGKQMGRKKRKSEEVKREHAVKNSAPINHFLMYEGKVWKRNFAGKCTRDHPKGTKTPACAFAGTSVENALLIATIRPVMWGHAPSPPQSTTNSRSTSKSLQGDLPLPFDLISQAGILQCLA